MPRFVLLALRVISGRNLCLIVFVPCVAGLHAPAEWLSHSLTQGVAVVDQNDRPRSFLTNNPTFSGWFSEWERNVESTEKNSYCNKETGEEIGWILSHELWAYYWAYAASGELKWITKLTKCADALTRRAIIEPDGFPGWPKLGAAATTVDRLDIYNSDSLLGEAMAFRPIVLISKEILATPALKESYGVRAQGYIDLSKRLFEKWSQRGAWRSTADGGTISVVLPFGIGPQASDWTEGYGRRNDLHVGFSHPSNKATLVAGWLVAMFDATGDPIYMEKAAGWFRLLKARMTLQNDNAYNLWNYWQPSGAWDYNDFGQPKHWIGVHPNAAYYDIDVSGVVLAYEHHVVFDKGDIDRLIATAIDDKRYWRALSPYNDAILREVEKNVVPNDWDGLVSVPWCLALERRRTDAELGRLKDDGAAGRE